MSTTPRVVGVAEAAKRIGVPARTLRRRIKEGHVAATKTGPGTAAYVLDEVVVAQLEKEGAKA